MESKKHKLIIIDDEYVVIKGLKTTIDWDALNIEIVAECRNGEEGLEAIERLKPDLVISDIRMPKLDGLSLAKKLSEDNFDGAIIIHSGYSDFEYARLAIDYGVTKYILKPIENKDFIRCIEEALQELEIDRKKRKALEQYTMGLPFIKENLIEQVITGNNATEAIQNLKLIGITVPPYGIVIEGSLLKKAGGGVPFAEFWTLYDELINSLNDYKIISQKYDGRFVIITGLTRVSAVYNFVREFLDRNSHQSQCRVSIGISDVYNESHTLQEAYLQAKKLREDYLFENFNNIKTAEMSKEGKNRKKIVDDALKIIADDYGKKLQIKKIAERLYVSESHLMHEFKESLGLTFIECLTEYRMMKAKELLSEGGFRIKEVASRVGFSDVRYFSVVFKDTVGMSPSDYLEKSKKNHDK